MCAHGSQVRMCVTFGYLPYQHRHRLWALENTTKTRHNQHLINNHIGSRHMNIALARHHPDR